MPSLRTVIGLIVTVTWSMTYLYAVVDPKFSPNPAVSPVMLLVAGFLFAPDIRKRKNGNAHG